MDAGRSHETPGSGVKDFFTHNTSSSRSVSLIRSSSPCPQDPREQYREARKNALQEKKLILGKSNLAKWSVGKLGLCPGVKQYLCLPRFGEAVGVSSRIVCNHPWEEKVKQKIVPLLARLTNTCETRENCLSTIPSSGTSAWILLARTTSCGHLELQGRVWNWVFLAEHIAALNKIVVLLVRECKRGMGLGKNCAQVSSSVFPMSFPQCITHFMTLYLLNLPEIICTT